MERVCKAQTQRSDICKYRLHNMARIHHENLVIPHIITDIGGRPGGW
jgi:hypothetical protein